MEDGMRSPGRALTIVDSTAPANSQFTVVLDSTRCLTNSQASVASGAAGLIPGSFRGRWTGGIVSYSALTTTQNVTLLLQDLTGVGGVAGDWETQGAGGSVTVTAGTTSVGEFKPLTSDFRVVVQAGATGPATCVVRLKVEWSGDYGA
jgi:hypothetical protein